MAQITTTDDLRKYLCSAIKMAGNGSMSSDKVRDVVKLSSQVHESLYSESRIMQLQKSLGVNVNKLGKLHLHSEGE